MISLNPWKIPMEFYARFTDGESDTWRNFDFMLLLGAFFFSCNSNVFQTIHILQLIHISLKFHSRSLCLF